jgi:polyhydroxybutyrate depolymerase
MIRPATAKWVSIFPIGDMSLARLCLVHGRKGVKPRPVPMLHRLLVLFAFVLAANAAVAAPCAPGAPCQIATGQYLARAPAGWNGADPLTVVVFFHGWRETAESVLADPVVTTFAETQRLLLVAPTGAGMTWSYPGSPGRHRDEFAFVAQLLADLPQRFPVIASEIYASGFSQGGSMVWYLACYMPQGFAGFLPVAGGFWEPAPRDCPGGPVRLVHVHGTQDGTVPLQGRRLRGGMFRQADILRDWPIWTRNAACTGQKPAAPDASAPDYVCQTQESCAAGPSPALCLRPGGHALMPDDLAIGWRLLQSARAGNP